MLLTSFQSTGKKCKQKILFHFINLNYIDIKFGSLERSKTTEEFLCRIQLHLPLQNKIICKLDFKVANIHQKIYSYCCIIYTLN